MRKTSDPAQRQTELRSMAVAELTGPGKRTPVGFDASSALGVLFELASSPETATRALALLHELQVHQVELELQEEELRRSHIELEKSLHRQLELYDSSPVGLVSIDRGMMVRELNQAAASLLGSEHGQVLGRELERWLATEAVRTLRDMLARLREGSSAEFADMELLRQQEPGCHVHASARADPAGGGYLVALMEVAGAPPRPASR